MNRPIALLTDFGNQDHFVGSLKGVILSIHPNAVVFDVTHEIRPQNIWDAAFVLRSVYPYVPKGTIFVVVIDPGVGSAREALCVKTRHAYLLAPNNGVLSMVLRNEKEYQARIIQNDCYFLKPVSRTFHGRDIFAPAAAHLSRSDVFSDLGPRLNHPRFLNLPEPVLRPGRITGQILYLDRFGNAITNISRSFLGNRTNFLTTRILIRNKIKAKPKTLFCEGNRRELIALWNSTGLLELAVRDGSAGREFGVKVGDSVQAMFEAS